MREISNHFVIIPEALVMPALLMRENVAIPSAAREYSCTSRVIFDQSSSDSDEGTAWTQTFRAVTKDPEVMRHDGEKACIGVILSDGDMKVIGGPFGVPVIKVTPYTGAYVVETTFQTPVPAEL